MQISFQPANLAFSRPMLPAREGQLVQKQPAADSVHFSGKKAALPNTPENREAVATTLTQQFPFEQYVDYLDALAVADGEDAGSVKERYTEDKIDELKTALIDYFRDGEDHSVKDIQDALKNSLKASTQKDTFAWLRAIEREMGY